MAASMILYLPSLFDPLSLRSFCTFFLNASSFASKILSSSSTSSVCIPNTGNLICLGTFGNCSSGMLCFFFSVIIHQMWSSSSLIMYFHPFFDHGCLQQSQLNPFTHIIIFSFNALYFDVSDIIFSCSWLQLSYHLSNTLVRNPFDNSKSHL